MIEVLKVVIAVCGASMLALLVICCLCFGYLLIKWTIEEKKSLKGNCFLCGKVLRNGDFSSVVVSDPEKIIQKEIKLCKHCEKEVALCKVCDGLKNNPVLESI